VTSEINKLSSILTNLIKLKTNLNRREEVLLQELYPNADITQCRHGSLEANKNIAIRKQKARYTPEAISAMVDNLLDSDKDNFISFLTEQKEK